MAESVQIYKDISKLNEEHKNAKRIFDYYKELRRRMGKPSPSPYDPAEVKKNLTGCDILTLIEELKKRGKLHG